MSMDKNLIIKESNGYCKAIYGKSDFYGIKDIDTDKYLSKLFYSRNQSLFNDKIVVEFLSLVTPKKYRKNGYATMLVNYGIKNNSGSKIILTARSDGTILRRGINEDNKFLIGFYEKFGFILKNPDIGFMVRDSR